MNYNNDNLRQLLASEYVLGTLRGAARRRFERLLRADAALRRIVQEWESRLTPLAHALPEVRPPARVWENIRRRIEAQQPAAPIWDRLGFWRGLTALASSAALALSLYLALVPRAPVEPAGPSVPNFIAVLADDKAQPVMMLNAVEGARAAMLVVLHPQQLPADKAYELWLLPKEGNPRSVGLIPASGRALVPLTLAAEEVFRDVPALAVSLEPAGGSPTGLPTGPVLFKGALTNL